MTGSSGNGFSFWRNFVSPHVAVLLVCASTLPEHYLIRCSSVLVLVLRLRITVSPSFPRAPSLLTVSYSTAATLYVAALYVIAYTLCTCSSAEACTQTPVGVRHISPDSCERTLSSCSACRLWSRARFRQTAAYNSRTHYCHSPWASVVGFVGWGGPIRRAAGVAKTRHNLFCQRSFGGSAGRIVPTWDVKLRNASRGQHLSLQALNGKDGKIEVYSPASPLLCKVVSVQKANGEDSGLTESASGAPEIFSIVLDHHGKLRFREGQSVGIIPRPPAASAAERAPTLVNQDGLTAGNENCPRSSKLCVRPRLYSIASGRHGDDGLGNTITLCVKKHVYRNPLTGVREPLKDGLCSNYLCSVRPGDTVAVSGPVGKALLLPAQGSPPLIMLGTGTGVAPFRSHVAQLCADASFQNQQAREVFLFLGSRSAASLPYMAEWEALKGKEGAQGFDVHFAWSRPADGEGKKYIQDLVWAERGKVWAALADRKGHLYVCGLKDMLGAVESVLNRMAAERQLTPGFLVRQLKMERRWHVEVY